MKRRRFLEAVVAAASLAGWARRSPGQSPPASFGRTAARQSSPPDLATVEAVRAASAKDVAELAPELAEYFSQYGARFAGPSGWSAEQARTYTRFLQRSLGEPADGVLTLKQSATLLTRPRCGFPDSPPGMAVVLGARWRSPALTYWVDPGMRTNLTVDQWRDILGKAWGQWSAVSPVRGTPSSSAMIANCLHSSGAGATAGFDGPAGVLAWAELPPSNIYIGQLLNRYDSGETWAATPQVAGIRALNVACHEIGHLLGLDHSGNPSDLMAPFYDPSVPAPVAGDIARIRRLYPELTPGDPVPPPPPVDPPPPPVGPVDPTGPTDPPNCPPRSGPRWFPNRPRLFPRRRGIC